MIIISTIQGPANIPDDAIARILGPAPGLPFTQVFGPATAPIIDSVDAPAAILSQMHTTPSLVKFTTPIGTDVWVKPIASVVTMVLPPPPGPDMGVPIGSVLQVGGRLQTLKDPVPAVLAVLKASGWGEPPFPHTFAAELFEGDDVFKGPLGKAPYYPWQ